MAITKVAQFAGSPASTADYQAQNAHINAFIQQMGDWRRLLQNWLNTNAPTISQGVYLRHAGVLYIVDTSAYAIAAGDLAASGVYYIRIKDDGAGEIEDIDWEGSRSGYNWNPAYHGIYDASGHQLLPYYVYYNSIGGTYDKWKILNFDHISTDNDWVLVNGTGKLNVMGGFEAGMVSIDTTSGAVTTGALTANSINTGTELRTRVVNIGDWNMDTTASVNVAHSLTASKIRSITGAVRNDDDDWWNVIDAGDNLADDGGTGASGFVSILKYDGTNITLGRTGQFDSAYYDSTTFNRGWLTITHIP